MPYSSVDDMTSRFGDQELIDLTDDDFLAVNVVTVNAAIQSADALIDSYIGTRYQLPLSTVPAVLVNVSCDVARYYLYNDQRPETVEKGYSNAVHWLGQVSKGTVTLGLDAANQSASQSESMVEMSSASPVWSRKDSKGFM